MNWKDFKEQVEAAGVTDEDEMDYIDTSGSFTGEIRVFKDEDGFLVSGK